eukprot:CAMPEP_0119492582 /NCGR_PEP_ID=MMETSP1344-20130328/17086_1 /TAXON_ID=236787 /ORGANISM="Florenciella parvula, Strain CCMP2471" /LENGTH=183 /DNA_ID=CAMNT_0007527925 /DNA_START=1 /DNA_END=549 /DNA_ORIENTATION=+
MPALHPSHPPPPAMPMEAGAEKKDGQKRKRVAWTKVEEAALRRGYTKYKESATKWADILKDDSLVDDFRKNPGDGPGQNTLRRSVDLKDKWKNMHSEKAAAKRQRLEEEAGGKTKQSELSEPKTRQLHLLEQHLPMLTNVVNAILQGKQKIPGDDMHFKVSKFKIDELQEVAEEIDMCITSHP